VEGAEQVSHGVDRHAVEEDTVHHFLKRDHSRHLSGAATEAHNDCCALLVGLRVSQHNPEGDVVHVRSKTVVLVVDRNPKELVDVLLQLLVDQVLRMVHLRGGQWSRLKDKSSLYSSESAKVKGGCSSFGKIASVVPAQCSRVSSVVSS
jgi:hypothetical protein